MDNETEKIIEEQIKKLPREVVVFLSSADWDADVSDVGALYNLSSEEAAGLKREVTLVLAGLVHPDEFSDVLEQEVGIKGAILEAVVNRTEQKIFTPIRPALVKFFEKESAEEVPQVLPVPLVLPVPNVPPVSLDIARLRADTHGQAPDNLPTGKTESFLPNLAPKTVAETEEPTHPFEEKMKRVFTAGQQSMSDLAIEPAHQNFLEENLGGQAIQQTFTPVAPAPQTPKAPPVKQADPYREAIE